MFGMSDPSQVIDQISRYRTEGRLEIAEVMAQELSMLLQHDKNRDFDRDAILVRSYRQLTGILQQREMWKKAASAVKQLNKCRDSHIKRAKKEGFDDLGAAAAGYAAADEILFGKICIGQGKSGKAVKRFGISIKLDGDDLEPFILRLEAVESAKGNLNRQDKNARALAKRIESAGPVNRLDGVMVLQPREHGPRSDAQRLITAMTRFTAPNSGLNEATRERLKAAQKALESQIQSIESGEQAANARLAAAVEKLQPSMDYHSYSGS
jgi:lipopolysaccharide biosynthesis regulator YciM